MKKILVVMLTMALIFTMVAPASYAATTKKVKKIQITSPKASTYVLQQGGKTTFKIKLTPKGVSKSVTWKSSNKKIATVSSKGVVKGIAPGKAKITVTSKANKKAKASKTVKVTAKVASATISGKAVAGATLTAKALPTKATVKYQWYAVKSGTRTPIAGATTATYTVAETEVGTQIQVGVSGTGYYTGTVYSGALAAISKANAIKNNIDKAYPVTVIENLTKNGSHPALGFRMAGSQAEKDCSTYIANEYKKMGLTPHVEKTKTDKWEFKKGELTYNNGTTTKTVQLSSYQTTFQTGGPKDYKVVYAGRGYKADYDALAASGVTIDANTVVLVDTDQFNTYWINFPSYEVHVRGAAAILACEWSNNLTSPPALGSTGFSMLSDTQLQSDDVCSASNVPALSISRQERTALIAAMTNNTINVTLDVDAKVTLNKDDSSVGSQNVWVEIPGKSKETILVMAHYDSYFKAALDDADGTAINMTLAKAIASSGLVPEKTIRFVHHGSEEWGMSGSIRDFSIGAWRQINDLHPEWAKDTFATVNVDSFTVENRNTASSVYRKLRVNAPQLEKFTMGTLNDNLPAGYSVGRYDAVVNKSFEDFSYMTKGIPKLLFTRTDYQSQYDTYHSSEDTLAYYKDVAKQVEIAGDKVQIVGSAVLSFDSMLVKPFDFASFFNTLNTSIASSTVSGGTISGATAAKTAATEANAVATELDEAVAKINAAYIKAVASNNKAEIARLKVKAVGVNADMYNMYAKFQQDFTKLDITELSSPGAPHVAYQRSVNALTSASAILEDTTPNTANAIKELEKVDLNKMARKFSHKTQNYATAQICGNVVMPDLLDGSANPITEEMLTWAKGMVEKPATDLYDVINDLAGTSPDFAAAKTKITTELSIQKGYLTEMLGKEKTACNAAKNSMSAILAKVK